MIHVPFQVMVLLIFGLFYYTIPYSSLWVFLCYAALVIGGGLAVHAYYERPMRAYLKRRLASPRVRPGGGRRSSAQHDRRRGSARVRMTRAASIYILPRGNAVL